MANWTTGLGERSLPWLAALVILVGGGLRFAGLHRGSATFDISGVREPRQVSGFCHFHPDETTLLAGALALESLLDPPFTGYGGLPLCLLRGVLEGLDHLGLLGQAEGGGWSQDRVYAVARTLSAAASTVTLVAVWVLGQSLLFGAGGLLAVGFLAFSPLAIQQAHFYTVDSLFCLFTTLALVSFVRAPKSPRGHLLSGVLVGLAASVRPNGLLLLAVPPISAAIRDRRTLATWLRLALGGKSWLMWAAAVLVILAMQPYMVTDPSILWRGTSPLDMPMAMAVAQGNLLQIWTMQYMGTVPVLYHWMHLMPLSVGWPLALACSLALVLALWARLPDTGLAVLVAWAGVYFASVAVLYAKPVRYLLPLLPPLALLAASLCLAAWRCRRLRGVGRAAAMGVCCYTVAYGLAFAGIYSVEDSRLESGRWLLDHVPPGSKIAVEGGAFSMKPILREMPYEIRLLGVGSLFEARGQVHCGVTATLLRRNLDAADYLVICDANRQGHFRASREILPVVASFYDELLAGTLGYNLVARFKHYPELMGARFTDDGVEHSFLGYDHPAVLVFKRASGRHANLAWETWTSGLQQESYCADSDLRSGCATLRAGDPVRARRAFQRAMATPTAGLVGAFLDTYARYLAGDAAVDLPFTVHELMAYSLTDLGLPDLAMLVLRKIAPGRIQERQRKAKYMALVADALGRGGHDAQSREAFRLSCDLVENRFAHNGLALHAYAAGDLVTAIDHWEQSLRLDDSQAIVHARMAAALAEMGDTDLANEHARRALRLDPSLKEKRLRTSRDADRGSWME